MERETDVKTLGDQLAEVEAQEQEPAKKEKPQDPDNTVSAELNDADSVAFEGDKSTEPVERSSGQDSRTWLSGERQ